MTDKVGEVAMASYHTYCLSFTGREETWISELEGSHPERFVTVIIPMMNAAAKGNI